MLYESFESVLIIADLLKLENVSNFGLHEAENDECLGDLAHKQFYATQKFRLGFIGHQKSSPRAGV